MYNIKKKIEQDNNNGFTLEDISKYDKLKVYWISGKSGIGKTTKAFEILKQYLKKNEKFDMIKYRNGFYLGASDKNKACLYDDWRDNDMKPEELLHLIDYNKHMLNIKGG